jgi:hypothetical protein
MRSEKVVGDQVGTIGQYNNLRDDAKGAGVLLAHQQDTPDLTLHIEEGTYYFKGEKVDFAGGDTDTFTDPSSDDRIDVVTIDETGTLSIIEGVEDATPAMPDIPVSVLPICAVYMRAGASYIKDDDDSVNGYIYKDLRPFLVYSGKSPIIRVYTANDTWNKPNGLKYVKVKAVGGGQAGGQAPSTSLSPITYSKGKGGDSGVYAEKVIAESDLGDTESVAVGAGGVANDGAGGQSNFGSHVVANGQTTPTTGDINLAKMDGNAVLGPTQHFDVRQVRTSARSVLAPYGNGGEGGGSASGGPQNNGSNGSAGIVIVEEHYC